MKYTPFLNQIQIYFVFDIIVDCYAKSTNSTEMLECANGNLAQKWKGCINQGSIRIRCPKDTFPCNSRVNNGKEFSCLPDCSENGGRKECSDDGMNRKMIS